MFPVPLGALKVVVSKEGFLASTTTLNIDTAKEWALSIEMKLAEEVEEEIAVYAVLVADRNQQDSVNPEMPAAS